LTHLRHGRVWVEVPSGACDASTPPLDFVAGGADDVQVRARRVRAEAALLDEEAKRSEEDAAGECRGVKNNPSERICYAHPPPSAGERRLHSRSGNGGAVELRERALVRRRNNKKGGCYLSTCHIAPISRQLDDGVLSRQDVRLNDGGSWGRGAVANRNLNRREGGGVCGAVAEADCERVGTNKVGGGGVDDRPRSAKGVDDSRGGMRGETPHGDAAEEGGDVVAVLKARPYAAEGTNFDAEGVRARRGGAEAKGADVLNGVEVIKIARPERQPLPRGGVGGRAEDVVAAGGGKRLENESLVFTKIRRGFIC
jgi:hypothetical protein